MNVQLFDILFGIFSPRISDWYVSAQGWIRLNKLSVDVAVDRVARRRRKSEKERERMRERKKERKRD